MLKECRYYIALLVYYSFPKSLNVYENFDSKYKLRLTWRIGMRTFAGYYYLGIFGFT
jgi:hypothetical protein